MMKIGAVLVVRWRQEPKWNELREYVMNFYCP